MLFEYNVIIFNVIMIRLVMKGSWYEFAETARQQHITANTPPPLTE